MRMFLIITTSFVNIILMLDMPSLDTWFLTLDIWYLTIDMLSLDIWHMLSLSTDTLDLMLWHLSGQYYTWHLYYIVYSWLLLLQGLDIIIILLRDIWYSWTPVSLVLMSHALLLLLIAQSYRRPTEHAAWCRDDENVSHNHASVRRILNVTKCHTEQCVTPHTWWGPPLESVGATSRIYSPHRAKCHID